MKKLLTVLGIITLIMAMQVTALPAHAQTQDKTDQTKAVDIYEDPDAAKGTYLDFIATFETDPTPNDCGSAYATVKTLEGRRLVIVLPADTVSYSKGDTVEIQGAVAGTTTTNDGAVVPLLDDITA